MILFHRTDAAEDILRNGFRDGEGDYLTGQLFRGVFLSSTPLDLNEEAVGESLLAVDIDEAVIAEYEWIEDGKPYREWCVPAAILNESAHVTQVQP